MPKLLLLILVISTFVACNLPQDDDFLAHQGEFKEILKPDNTFKILDTNYYKKELATFQTFNQTLQGFEMDRLLPENQVIFNNLNQKVQQKLWELETFKAHQWNPTQYSVMEEIRAKYADTSNLKQTEDLIVTLKQIPIYYKAAKQNIQQPTRFHSELAIQQQEDTYFFIANELTDFLNKTKPESQLKNTFQFHQQKSLLAVKDFLGFLNSCINNANDGNETEVLKTLEEKQKVFLEHYVVQSDSIDWVNFKIYKGNKSLN